MKIKIISFTNKGYELSARIQTALPSHDAELIYKGRKAGDHTADPSGLSLSEICGEAFEQAVPLVFIGAAGIAVRSIAPFVKDKLTDPPVIVIDELGRFVIPLLSGHVGGANALAAEIADAADAVPVITTATDINDAFSADVFARENGLAIHDREGIARVSTSALSGKPVTISIKGYPPVEHVDVLITEAGEPLPDYRALKDAASIVLCPKRYALGMGCRRGKPFEELRDFALKTLGDNGIELSEVGCIATIDVKKDEDGLKALSQAWRIPLVTYDAEVLAGAKGEFTSSETVLEKVGVDNVCERAAFLAAGPGAELTVRKTASSGMTAAVAERARG